MLSRIEAFIKEFSKNSALFAVATGIFGIFLGATLNKLIPALWSGLKKFVLAVMTLSGGRLALRSFEKRYLNWMAIEHRDLKLTGIVTTEETKKPLLDQVFLSLFLSSSRKSSDMSLRHQPFLPSSYFSTQEFRRLLKVQRKLNKESGQPNRLLFDKAYKELKRVQAIPGTAISLNLPGWIGYKGETRAELDEWFARWKEELQPAIEESQIRYILQENQRIAILGGPGAGKTTLLQYIALTLARHRVGDKKLRDKSQKYKDVAFDSWLVPVFIRLTTIAGIISRELKLGNDPTLIDILPRLTNPDLQADKVAARYFNKCVSRGRVIFLLDGLDEVPTDQDFQAVVRVLESTLTTYPDNRFVITSRIAGWRGGLRGNFSIFEVNDLSDKQIDRFVVTWYSAVEQNSVIGPLEKESQAEKDTREQRAQQRAENLLQTLQANVGIRRIASNPMLLSIIALVHRSLTTLPRERSKLYSKCSEILLEQWDIFRGVRVDDTMLRLEQKEAIMMRLAIAFHKGEIGEAAGGREASRREVSAIVASLMPTLGRVPTDADHLLQRLIDRSGLLIERSRDVLAFSHHTFQEYFAARHLAQDEHEEARFFLLAIARLMSDWWREVILLYAGLIADASEFVSLVRGDELEDDLCLKRVRLAALCSAEAVQIRDADIRLRLIAELAEVREEGGQLSGELKNRKEVTDYLVGWSKGREWFSAAALISAQRRIGDVKGLLMDKLQAALSDNDSAIRCAALECARRLDGISFETREAALSLLDDETSEVVDSAALLFLETIDSESSDERFGKVGQTLERQIRQSGGKEVETIIRGLSELQVKKILAPDSSQSNHLRRVVESFAEKTSEPMTDDRANLLIKDAFRDERKLTVRRIPSLGQRSLQRFQRSVNALLDRFLLPRRIVLRAIDDRRLTSVMAALGTELPEGAKSSSVMECIAELKSEELSIRRAAAEALAAFMLGRDKKGGPLASEVRAILDEASPIEQLVIWTGLSELHSGFEVSEEDINWWALLLRDRSSAVRVTALRCLKRGNFALGKAPVTAILKDSVRHSSRIVRCAAVEAAGVVLSRGHGLDIINIILHALDDKSLDVRISAIEAAVFAWDSLAEKAHRETVLRAAVGMERLLLSPSNESWGSWLRVLGLLSFMGQKFATSEVFGIIKTITTEGLKHWSPLNSSLPSRLSIRQALMEVGNSLDQAALCDEIGKLLAGSEVEQVLGLELIRDGALVGPLDIALEVVASLARDSSILVRFAAIQALGACAVVRGYAKGVDLMIRTLDDENRGVREVSWLSLRSLGLLGANYSARDEVKAWLVDPEIFQTGRDSSSI